MTDKERTITGGLIGGQDDYEYQMRRKLVHFLGAFRTVDEMERWLQESRQSVASIQAINLTLADMRDRLKAVEDELEAIEDRRRAREMFVSNFKAFLLFFIPLATALTFLVNGWGWFVTYLRGGSN